MTETNTDPELLDYLFDLQGYLLLENAIVEGDLREMNQWVDENWEKAEEDHRRQGGSGRHDSGQWIGNVETQSYDKNDGVNFQNIIEGGAVFERLIDYPAWIGLAKRYINSSVNGLSIHENFLSMRGPGGYLYIHCGGHAPLCYLTFRQHNTGEWMVGQINVLIALNDIGPGDGPTVLVPGSHKCTEIHPRLNVGGAGKVSISGEPAGTAIGMKEIYMVAGDALFFTDAITHGSAERTHNGFRRTVVYRYSPRFVRTRFNYVPSNELLERLTDEQRKIVQPIPPRRPPYEYKKHNLLW